MTSSSTIFTSCESELLMCGGAQMIYVSNIPFGCRVLVNYLTSPIHNLTSMHSILREAPGVFQLISQILLYHNLLLSALK